MRIAVISDIHGNDFAFQKVELDIKKRGVDQIVCLGDTIQGGPQAAETIKRLRDLKCPVVMGNMDTWMLTGIYTEREAVPPEQAKKMDAVREWAISQLAADDLDFIKGFQPTITINLKKDLNLLCFHGSPANFEDIIRNTTPEDEFQRLLSA